MLGNYRAGFRTPGTAAFCAAGLVMRLPISMYPLGLALIVSARTGHYGFAGVLSGWPELTTAFSLESVLDEVVFIVGPLLATVLDTHADPVLVLSLCGALVGAGAAWPAAQTATEPPV